MQSLPFDAFGKIASFLSADEIAIATSTCKSLFEFRKFPQLWDEIIGRSSRCVGDSFRAHLQLREGDLASDLDICHQIELAREVSRVETLKTVRWRRPSYLDESRGGSGLRLNRMEAHTMNSFLERYLVIIGGWDEMAQNEVSIIDGNALPECLLTISTVTESRPHFRYGFSSLVYRNQIFVFGGCRSGGYAGDCNDLYCISLQFCLSNKYEPSEECDWDTVQHAPIGHVKRVRATYSSNLTRETPATRNLQRKVSPITRAYHTSVCVTYNTKPVMVVFGGLHNQRPSNSLEVMNFDDLMWWQPSIVVGAYPHPRFGHSCSVASNGDMVIIGGSDGNDLWRNGGELCDAYVLSIVRHAGNDQFIWTQLNISSSMPCYVPGRCHAAASIENKIIMFGGGARISDDLVIFHYDYRDVENSKKILSSAQSRSTSSAAAEVDEKKATNVENTPGRSRLYFPNILPSKYRPSVRTSVPAVIIGPYWCMFGGWNKSRRELGDFWILDLTAGKGPPAASRVSAAIKANDLSRIVLEDINTHDQILESSADYRPEEDIDFEEISEENLLWWIVFQRHIV